MENLSNLWAGFQEDTLPTNNNFDNLQFGLNSGASILTFEHSTNTGSGGTVGNPALIIEVLCGTNKVNRRIYEPTKVYFENSEIQPNHPEYKKQFAKEITKVKSAVTHWVKSMGYTDEEVTAGLAAANNFESLIKLASNMINARKAVNKIDIFLQYQYKINGTADKTYLEIPKTLGYGAFVTVHQPAVGEWKATNTFQYKDAEGNVQVESKGLAYFDDNNNQHRFTRFEGFMKTDFAKQQTKGVTTVSGISNTNTGSENAAPLAW